MAKPSGTKQRILDTARELFTSQGVQQTSLQEIADRLGITKPALYYHFSSREELVRTIVAPLVDDGERFLERMSRDQVPPRELLEGFFDYNYRHRADILMLLTEMTTLAQLGLVDRVLELRTALTALLVGPNAPLSQQTRAIMALGGMQDCCLQFPDVTEDDLRAAVVDAACAALGIT